MNRFLLGTAIALCLSCGTVTEPEVGEEFRLRVGELAVVPGAGVWVAMIEVGADSRCPLRVQCVWAGDAAVLVEAAPVPDADAVAADSHTEILHTHLDPRSLALGTVELVLVGLDPYPETPDSIQQDQYVATFVVRAVP